MDEVNLIKDTVDCISELTKESDETLNKMADKAGNHLSLGFAMMAGGAALTPICPIVGPAIIEFGYGYSVGSTMVGGLASCAKFVKKIKE